MRLLFVLAAMPLLARDHSIRKERAMGEHLMSDALRQSKPLGIAAVSKYTDFAGSRLTSATAYRRYGYRFEVVAHPEGAEPYGFPGGFVLIPAKFFIDARNEGEFAGMLAHVIGHIEQRHGLRPARPGTIPLIFTGGWTQAHAGATPEVLIPNGLREMQRANELAADKYAVPLLAAAGFDAEALRRYLARVHPEAGREERLEALDASLATVESKPTGESGFDPIREMVRAALPVKPVKPPTLRR